MQDVGLKQLDLFERRWAQPYGHAAPTFHGQGPAEPAWKHWRWPPNEQPAREKLSEPPEQRRFQ